MSDREYKSYESRLRRAVHRQGYSLQRSRRRDPRAYDYSTYMITDPENNTLALEAEAAQLREELKNRDD